MSETGPVAPPPPKRLLWQILGAFAVASVVFVLAILPAEYGEDPTGFGRLTGLTQISEPALLTPEAEDAPEEIAKFEDTPFRSDTIEIELAGDFDYGFELEWKAWMRAGDTMVYSWDIPDATCDIYFDFHGETAPPNMEVMTYRQDVGTESHGALTAPKEGFHGWYFQNCDVPPLTVVLHLAGYYELREYPPPGWFDQ